MLLIIKTESASNYYSNCTCAVEIFDLEKLAYLLSNNSGNSLINPLFYNRQLLILIYRDVMVVTAIKIKLITAIFLPIKTEEK